MKRSWWLLSLVIISIIILSVFGLVGAKGNFKTAPAIGSNAPKFSLPDLEGRTVSLRRILKTRQVTVLNFWTTWCPPCRGEIPELNDFYRTLSGRVALLAIDLKEEPEWVRQFAREQKIIFPVLTDNAGEVAEAYQIYTIPNTFIIDRRGKIRYIIRGATNAEKLKTLVMEVLKGDK